MFNPLAFFTKNISDSPAMVHFPNLRQQIEQQSENALSDEQLAVLQQQEFEQSSANQAMEHASEEARLNRDWQTNANRLAMEHSSREAELNRQWVDNQRATAYQTAVADLKAAGLNPILASSGSGAAVVSGQIGSGYTSNGGQGTGFAASGSRAQTDYTGSRQLMQTLISSAASIGLGVALRRFRIR